MLMFEPWDSNALEIALPLNYLYKGNMFLPFPTRAFPSFSYPSHATFSNSFFFNVTCTQQIPNKYRLGKRKTFQEKEQWNKGAELGSEKAHPGGGKQLTLEGCRVCLEEARIEKLEGSRGPNYLSLMCSGDLNQAAGGNTAGFAFL